MTKNYKIDFIADRGHYATLDGATVGGPYDTEEKAKRRIRDLKRADAKIATHDKHVADGDTGSKSIGAQIASDPQAGESVINADASHPAHKLAMSSAYGNMTTPVGRAIFPELQRPVAYGKINSIIQHRHELLPQLSAINADFGTVEYDDAWVGRAYAEMDARKPRNGYRPVHRANRFRGAR